MNFYLQYLKYTSFIQITFLHKDLTDSLRFK